MADIMDVYRSKIIDTLAVLCVDAYKEGFTEGMKTGMEIKNSKCSSVEPFDYDEEKLEEKVIGKNDSHMEYKSEINKDLGILGE